MFKTKLGRAWAARTADVVIEAQPGTDIPAGPSIVYACRTLGCKNRGQQITIQGSIQAGFVIGMIIPVCAGCKHNATKVGISGF